MNIEQRARELLAAEHQAEGAESTYAHRIRTGQVMFWSDEVAIRAIIAALTVPEGERLSESEKDVALAQAVEFAEYVERQAKGSMRDAAARFLSLPYAQQLAKRIAPEVSP